MKRIRSFDWFVMVVAATLAVVYILYIDHAFVCLIPILAIINVLFGHYMDKKYPRKKYDYRPESRSIEIARWADTVFVEFNGGDVGLVVAKSPEPHLYLYDNFQGWEAHCDGVDKTLAQLIKGDLNVFKTKNGYKVVWGENHTLKPLNEP